MTEDEALEKFCHVGFAGNTAGLCVASKCMAWRWRFVKANETYKTASDKAGYLSGTEGYCGLAGKP